MNKARLPDRVISAVSNAVRSLSVAAAGGSDKAPGAAGVQEGTPAPTDQVMACQGLQERDVGGNLFFNPVAPGSPRTVEHLDGDAAAGATHAPLVDHANGATTSPMQLQLQHVQEAAGGVHAAVSLQPLHQQSLASAADVGVQPQQLVEEALDLVATTVQDGSEGAAAVGAQRLALAAAGVKHWKRLHRQEQE